MPLSKKQMDELQKDAAEVKEDRVRTEERVETLREQASRLNDEFEEKHKMSVGKALKKIEDEVKAIDKTAQEIQEELTSIKAITE